MATASNRFYWAAGGGEERNIWPVANNWKAEGDQKSSQYDSGVQTLSDVENSNTKSPAYTSHVSSRSQSFNRRLSTKTDATKQTVEQPGAVIANLLPPVTLHKPCSQTSTNLHFDGYRYILAKVTGPTYKRHSQGDIPSQASEHLSHVHSTKLPERKSSKEHRHRHVSHVTSASERSKSTLSGSSHLRPVGDISLAEMVSTMRSSVTGQVLPTAESVLALSGKVWKCNRCGGATHPLPGWSVCRCPETALDISHMMDSAKSRSELITTADTERKAESGVGWKKDSVDDGTTTTLYGTVSTADGAATVGSVTLPTVRVRLEEPQFMVTADNEKGGPSELPIVASRIVVESDPEISPSHSEAKKLGYSNEFLSDASRLTIWNPYRTAEVTTLENGNVLVAEKLLHVGDYVFPNPETAMEAVVPAHMRQKCGFSVGSNLEKWFPKYIKSNKPWLRLRHGEKFVLDQSRKHEGYLMKATTSQAKGFQQKFVEALNFKSSRAVDKDCLIDPLTGYTYDRLCKGGDGANDVAIDNGKGSVHSLHFIAPKAKYGFGVSVHPTIQHLSQYWGNPTCQISDDETEDHKVQADGSLKGWRSQVGSLSTSANSIVIERDPLRIRDCLKGTIFYDHVPVHPIFQEEHDTLLHRPQDPNRHLRGDHKDAPSHCLSFATGLALDRETLDEYIVQQVVPPFQQKEYESSLFTDGGSDTTDSIESIPHSRRSSYSSTLSKSHTTATQSEASYTPSLSRHSEQSETPTQSKSAALPPVVAAFSAVASPTTLGETSYECATPQDVRFATVPRPYIPTSHITTSQSSASHFDDSKASDRYFPTSQITSSGGTSYLTSAYTPSITTSGASHARTPKRFNCCKSSCCQQQTLSASSSSRSSNYGSDRTFTPTATFSGSVPRSSFSASMMSSSLGAQSWSQNGAPSR